MDGADAVLIKMQQNQWQEAAAHCFVPFSDGLRRDLLALQDTGSNELHRSIMLSQTLSRLYAQAVQQLLHQTQLEPHNITAVGCHGQTVRHAPEHGYSVQLADLPLLAELTGIFTIGDFRSRDLAAGGQGAPLVPAFHQALFSHPQETRVVLNIGGIANISVLPPDAPAFGFDTGPGNMLMDAWVQHIWQQPYDKNGEKAAQGNLLPELFSKLMAHPYFSQPYPKSTGRELFSLGWLQQYLNGSERHEDVLRTLLIYTAQTVMDAVQTAASSARSIYLCGGGIQNTALTDCLNRFAEPLSITLHSTDALNLNPQWVEASAFAWLAACWINCTPSNPYHATGARTSCILGSGHYA